MRCLTLLSKCIESASKIKFFIHLNYISGQQNFTKGKFLVACGDKKGTSTD